MAIFGVQLMSEFVQDHIVPIMNIPGIGSNIIPG
jgi:hypothetical protein